MIIVYRKLTEKCVNDLILSYSGTSFGINYTGSENTDSFGVNAQARYMF